MSAPTGAPMDWEPNKPRRDDEIYRLRLYITGVSHHSIQALANIKQVCERYLADRYELEVVDLYRQPERASQENLVVAPMLVKSFPLPVRKLVGNLANTQELLRRLDISDGAVQIPQ
jgi:circadian clock protein KaiB